MTSDADEIARMASCSDCPVRSDRVTEERARRQEAEYDRAVERRREDRSEPLACQAHYEAVRRHALASVPTRLSPGIEDSHIRAEAATVDDLQALADRYYTYFGFINGRSPADVMTSLAKLLRVAQQDVACLRGGPCLTCEGTRETAVVRNGILECECGAIVWYNDDATTASKAGDR